MRSVTRHLAHNRLSKHAWLSADARQHRDAHIAHHVKQRNSAGFGRGRRELPSRNVPVLARQRLLLGTNSLAAFDDQAVAIESVNAAARLLFAEPFFFHGGDEKVCDAKTRRSRAEHGDGLVVKRYSGGINRRKQGRCCYRRGPLNVVVEGTQSVAVAVQQPRRVGAGKILPLQKNVRPAAFHSAHEGLDKIVVLLAADAMMLPADINRIVQQFRVVRAHVEQHGQALLGRNAAQRRVERHLADGNAHAAGALVTEAENALPVADDDAAHLVVARVGEDLRDAVFVRVAQEKAARLAPDLGEALAAFAHRRRVDDGEQFLGVLGDERIEQRLIVVLQVAHVRVFAECGVPAVEHAFAALTLVLERADVWRQQPVQREGIALRFSECRAFVETRVHEQSESVKVGAKAAMSSGTGRRGCGAHDTLLF